MRRIRTTGRVSLLYIRECGHGEGTNSSEIEETTSHKPGSCAVFNIAFEREGRKTEVISTRGVRIWSPIQVRSMPNKA